MLSQEPGQVPDLTGRHEQEEGSTHNLQQAIQPLQDQADPTGLLQEVLVPPRTAGVELFHHGVASFAAPSGGFTGRRMMKRVRP